jgi:hypothetical protein
MSCPTIDIAAALNPLPECSPNIMPFHLNYSGNAPITTYFRVKPATLRDESGGNVAQLSPETLSEINKEGSDRVAVATTSDQGAGDDTGAAMVSPSAQPAANANTQTWKKSSLGTRFVAAFRGRTVHGVTVDLPEGYSGIVLRAGEDGSRKGKAMVGRQNQEAAPKAKKGRLTRKASRIDVDGDIDMNNREGSSQEEDRECGPARTLNPTATFSSFVLWNPDLPVDEAKDEYLRSLTEWTRLAAEASLSLLCCVRCCMLTVLDVGCSRYIDLRIDSPLDYKPVQYLVACPASL